MHVIAGLGAGGAETQLANLATASRPHGPECMVVNLMPDDGGAIADRLAQAGIPTYHLGLNSYWNLARTQKRLARLIYEHAPNVVQSWMYYADLISLSATRRARTIGKIRYFWNVRCSDMDLSRYRRGLRRTVKLCAWRSGVPDGIVVNSIAGREAHADAGYRAKAWHLIDNGIDIECFAPGDRARARQDLEITADGPVAMHVARVDPMKDHDTLNAVAAACPGWTFVAVGEGTEGLDGPANLRTFGRRDDVRDLLPAGDVILSTSAFGEGFSNALAEGMASGLIPVATDVGGASRLVGGTGAIAAPGDVAELATALSGIEALSAGAREVRGSAARERIVNEFSITRMAERYDRLHRTGILH